jgi:hypothetical protein
MLLPIERKTQEIAVDVPALDDLTRNSLHLAVYFLLHRGSAKDCMGRIVPNYSAFRKRNRFGLQTYEAARTLGRQSDCRPPVE